MGTLRRTRDLETANPFITPNIVIQVVVCVVTTCFIALKCFVRSFYLRIWTAEDYLMVISWILLMTFVATNTVQVQYGGGQHLSALSVSDQQLTSKWIDVSHPIYSATMAFSRSAVLVTYMNVFTSIDGAGMFGKGTSRKGFDRRFIMAMIFINALFYTCSMLLKIFICIPRARYWDMSIPGHCLNLSALIAASGVWNTISDLVILLLPIIFVRRIKLRNRAKWQIIGVFTAGAISYPLFSIIGIVFRAVYVFNPDTTFWIPRILVFCEAEIAAGLICACVPSVTYLLKRLRARPITYTTSKGPRQPTSRRNFDDDDWRVTLGDFDSRAKGWSQHSLGPLPPSSSSDIQRERSMRSGRASSHDERNDDEQSDVPEDQPVEPKIWKTTQISIEYDERSFRHEWHSSWDNNKGPKREDNSEISMDIGAEARTGSVGNSSSTAGLVASNVQNSDSQEAILAHSKDVMKGTYLNAK